MPMHLAAACLACYARLTRALMNFKAILYYVSENTPSDKASPSKEARELTLQQPSLRPC